MATPENMRDWMINQELVDANQIRKIKNLESSADIFDRIISEFDAQLDSIVERLEDLETFLEPEPDPEPAPEPTPEPEPEPEPGPDGPTLFMPTTDARRGELFDEPTGLNGITGDWQLLNCFVNASKDDRWSYHAVINGPDKLSLRAFASVFQQKTGGQATIRCQNAGVGSNEFHGVHIYERCAVRNGPDPQNPKHRAGRFMGLDLLHIKGGVWRGVIDIGLHPDNPGSSVGIPCNRVILNGFPAEPLVIDSRNFFDVCLRVLRGNRHVTIGPHVRFRGDHGPWNDIFAHNRRVEILRDVTYNGEIIPPQVGGTAV